MLLDAAPSHCDHQLWASEPPLGLQHTDHCALLHTVRRPQKVQGFRLRGRLGRRGLLRYRCGGGLLDGSSGWCQRGGRQSCRSPCSSVELGRGETLQQLPLQSLGRDLEARRWRRCVFNRLGYDGGGSRGRWGNNLARGESHGLGGRRHLDRSQVGLGLSREFVYSPSHRTSGGVEAPGVVVPLWRLQEFRNEMRLVQGKVKHSNVFALAPLEDRHELRSLVVRQMLSRRRRLPGPARPHFLGLVLKHVEKSLFRLVPVVSSLGFLIPVVLQPSRQ
mmetsp:Transcript_19733/g.46143  ORF Transcript_19733/g.46143 Transcript_19733/m.46143 type:complete len:276 (-) Transcript_19733:963-1790(-)